MRNALPTALLLLSTVPALSIAQTAGNDAARSEANQTAVIHGGDGITLPAPPTVAAHPVVDTYQTTGGAEAKVTDQFRWLEDAKSPATRAFIAEENAYTQKYLDQVKTLPEVRTELAPLLKVDQMSRPVRRGDKLFFSMRKAEENQGSIYMREGHDGMRDGLHGADVLLIDGNKLSADGNTSATLQGVSEDGSLLIYGVRVGGADEEEIHFLDLATHKDLADMLPSARYSGVSLAPDRKGVYYSKYFPHQGSRVYFHAFGASGADAMLLGESYRGEALGEIDYIDARVTENGHWLVLEIDRGVPAKRVDLLLKDLRVPDAPLVPLVYGVESRFALMVDGDDFYVDTDLNAPNHRILKAVMGSRPEQWPVVVPESKEAIQTANIVGHRFFVLRLKDVSSELTSYTLSGRPAGKISFPGLGSGSGLSGRPQDHDGFYTFESILQPPTIFHYDVMTGKSEPFFTPKVPFDPSGYELHQVFYPSKDGTRVPMFIAGKKGLKRDGSERLLMTGYGGFALSELPAWNPEYAWWMEHGGWFALPNLRGGNEYGETWHKAAMFEKKQNVFDDWYAAAEYLEREKYTSPEHLAIRGRSNGGLLMGASMTQRPDLFGAIWCGYPLLDMLRYQRFLMGRTWTTEYGSAENAADYAYIAKYSPYQHVVMGTKYPAILFFTGDGDTRVDPMNARKMTPLMQEASVAQGGSHRPVLLHYSLKGGHSAGISQTQLVEDYADEMGFLWTETE